MKLQVLKPVYFLTVLSSGAMYKTVKALRAVGIDPIAIAGTPKSKRWPTTRREYRTFGRIFQSILVNAFSLGRQKCLQEKLTSPDLLIPFVTELQKRPSAFLMLPRKTQNFIVSLQHSQHARKRLLPDDQRKILLVTHNWSFLQNTVAELETLQADVRFLDAKVLRQPCDNERIRTVSHVAIMATSNDPNTAQLPVIAEENPIVGDLVDWSDVILVDWMALPAVILSHGLNNDSKLVVRVHSFEALDWMIFLVNYRRIDALVFIAEHIQTLFNKVVGPDLLAGIQQIVIPNTRHRTPAEPMVRNQKQRKTLGLTQYASCNKDPIFALDVLSQLREHDDAWSIRFVGTPWEAPETDYEAQYQEAFRERVRSLGDAVSIDPFTQNINEWYQEIGFIMSTSFREGSHESLVEAMMTGAVPALRRWPAVSPFGAPDTVFPDLPSFSTADTLAQHIKAETINYQASSDEATRYVEDKVLNHIDDFSLARFLIELDATSTG